MRGEKELIHIPAGHSFRVLRWENSLREVESVLSPHRAARIAGEGTHWHFHIEMELTLFTSGGGMRFVGDGIDEFGAGDLVLLGENLPHYWHTRGRSSGISVQWHFPVSHAFWAFPETLGLVDLFKLAQRGLQISGRAALEIHGLLQWLAGATGAERLAGLWQILGRLARAAENERRPISTRSFAISPSAQHEEAIAKAIRYLIANFREAVRLQALLELTGMSRPTFARQFKKHAGRTFSEFLNRLRLQAACRELEQSGSSVLDVALASGFTEISFFNRIFRRVMRSTPSAYRVRKARGA